MIGAIVASHSSWAGWPSFHFASIFHDAYPSAWTAWICPMPWSANTTRCHASDRATSPARVVRKRSHTLAISSIASTASTMRTVPGSGRNRSCNSARRRSIVHTRRWVAMP